MLGWLRRTSSGRASSSGSVWRGSRLAAALCQCGARKRTVAHRRSAPWRGEGEETAPPNEGLRAKGCRGGAQTGGGPRASRIGAPVYADSLAQKFEERAREGSKFLLNERGVTGDGGGRLCAVRAIRASRCHLRVSLAHSPLRPAEARRFARARFERAPAGRPTTKWCNAVVRQPRPPPSGRRRWAERRARPFWAPLISGHAGP